MKRKIKQIKCLEIILFVFFLTVPSVLYAASMTDYCSAPPFIAGKIQPNLLLFIDNSSSMYDLQYIAGSPFTSSSFSCPGGVSSATESFCTDDTYTDSKICSLNTTSCTQNSDCTAYGSTETCANGVCTIPVTACTLDSGCPSNGKCINYYSGYFKQTTVYQYQTSTYTPGSPQTNDYFQTVLSMPAACDFGGSGSATPYVCVYYNNPSSPTTVTGFYATGKFLNWLSASKFDVEKKILTGGKYSTSNSLLIGESRGCDGRRFVKLLKIPGSWIANTCTSNCYQPIAFAVRGPYALDPDNVKVGVNGGLTRIEIYSPTSATLDNVSSCQCAVANWNSGNYGQAQTQTTSCLGNNAKSSTLNHSLQSCWVLKNNIKNCIANNNCSDSVVWQGVNTTDVTGACESSYISQCGGNNSAYADGLGNVYCSNGNFLISNVPSGLPAKFTNPAAGDWVCTGGASHNLMPSNSGYDVDGNNTSGYVGNCVSFFSKPGTGNCNQIGYNGWNNECIIDWKTSGTVANNCVKEEILHYCYGASVAEVTDPSEGSSSSIGNMPSILVDSFTQTLGPVEGTFYARVSSSAPSGVIDTYSGQMSFGAMAFNYNGSNSECNVTGSNVPCVGYCSNSPAQQCSVNAPCSASAGSCLYDSKTDGGHIISYNSPNTGNHSSGLIYNIDNLQATSWTPFAEAFYSAIGYYAAVMVCSNSASTSCTKDSDCGTGGYCVYKNVCVNNSTQTCTADADCPATPVPQKCGHLSRDFRLQTGSCSITTSTSCNFDSNCPSGESCNIAVNNTTGDYNLGRNPSLYKCQPNNILLISDGGSTADLAPAPSNLANLYKWSANTALDQVDTSVVVGQCPAFAGSRNLDDLAYLAKNWNIKGFNTSAVTPKTCSTSGTSCSTNSDCPSPQTCLNSPQQASEYINTYVVYTGPLNDPNTNQCNPKNLMNDTAAKGGSTAAFTASNPSQLQTALTTAFEAIAGRAASGTAASVLASGEGSGANLVQAIFYPAREFGATEVDWTGRLQNFWYYIDPSLGGSTIMEDTDTDKALELNDDNKVTFAYNQITHDTTVTLTTPGGTSTSGVSLDSVKTLWEAGSKLLSMSPSNRTVYTNINDTSTMTSFLSTNAGSLQPFLGVSSTDAPTLIDYVRGVDTATTLTIDGTTVTPRNRTVTLNGVTGTWKLGDIVNSTPKILSWLPQNGYYNIYYDTSYQQFTNTAAYQSRGMVFTGANDGMLHAFKLGLLGIYNGINLKATLGKHCSTSTTKACSANSDCSSGICTTDSDLGTEMWTFIPKNSLPYLKYLAAPNYCHLYYVDAQPFIFDASFTVDTTANVGVTGCDTNNYWNCLKKQDGSGWRTVLIGSMRLGGACKNVGDTCQDCAKTPMSDPIDPTKGLGYSSYFALDITDPLNPKLLWEFSNPGLGFSTSGPAIVRVGTDSSVTPPKTLDSSHNGRWLVIFGSGPTGWISQNNNIAISSMYLSNAGLWNAQPNTMKLFVVDLATGSLVTTIDTAEQGAFAGSLIGGQIDFDQNDLSLPGNYQDDAVYFGFTKGYVPFVDSSITGGDARGGTANTMQLAVGSSTTNDFYKGNFIEMWQQDSVTLQWHYEGAKLITGYDGTTQTVTVDSNFPVMPTVGSPAPWTYYNISKGWTRGGVKRLLTKQDIDPTKWAVSTVIDSSSLGTDVGPVTSAVKKLENYADHSLRLFFGTGRYFYRIGDLLDDPSNLRALYGIKDPCFQATTTTPFYTIDSSCTNITDSVNYPNVAGNALKVLSTGIGQAATSAGINASTLQGWWIPLDGCKDSAFNIVDCSSSTAVYRAERVVNDPLATATGAVMFTTSEPTSDPCQYGGSSNLWAVRYDTGGTLVGTGILKGKVIIQTSTGNIAQIDLSTAFAGDTVHGQREAQISSAGLSGGTPSTVVPPLPVNRILHIKKR